jgi:hypothetical protein
MDDEEARRTAQIEWFKNALEHHENLSAAVVTFGQSLLRGALTLNGGAIVAVLTLYGALKEKPNVAGPLIMWALGLGWCAAAGYFAAKSQREFQVSAGHHSRRMAKQFFELQVPFQPVVPVDADDAKDRGLLYREIFWALWVLLIAFFVLGAFLAVYQLR